MSALITIFVFVIFQFLAVAPRLSNAAVPCNKNASHRIGLTQDAPRQVIVCTKRD